MEFLNLTSENSESKVRLIRGFLRVCCRELLHLSRQLEAGQIDQETYDRTTTAISHDVEKLEDEANSLPIAAFKGLDKDLKEGAEL